MSALLPELALGWRRAVRGPSLPALLATLTCLPSERPLLLSTSAVASSAALFEPMLRL